MINVEKLIREGKTIDEITEMLYAESEAVNKKIAEEKEAARIAEAKKAEVETAAKVAQEALQKVYDLTDGCIRVYIRDGKVSVISLSNDSTTKKSKNASLTNDYRGTCDDIWNDLLNILR